MSRENQTESLKQTTSGNSDNRALSEGIWRDMRDSRSDVPSLTTPSTLTLRDTATPKPNGDFNIATGTNLAASALPEVEFFDSAAPAKKETAPVETSGQIMDTTTKAETGSAQQQINGPIWETQSETLVGNYNGDKK